MAPVVDTDDLIDANEVAAILGLANRETVSAYLKTYPDMPRPVLEFGPRHPRLWIRQEIEAWAKKTGRPRR